MREFLQAGHRALRRARAGRHGRGAGRPLRRRSTRSGCATAASAWASAALYPALLEAHGVPEARPAAAARDPRRPDFVGAGGARSARSACPRPRPRSSCASRSCAAAPRCSSACSGTVHDAADGLRDVLGPARRRGRLARASSTSASPAGSATTRAPSSTSTTPPSARPIGGGGRYDELARPLRARRCPPSGFALDVDRLHLALAGEEAREPLRPDHRRPARRAFGEALDALDALGIATRRGARQRPQAALRRRRDRHDAPVATCRPTSRRARRTSGITGKDVLLEQAERRVFELLDLGFGRCRMVLATVDGEPDPAAEALRRLGVLRVATKYPRIASRYLEDTGRQAEIVEVKGSVELAPLTGLVEAIVDLTATGTTLRENGLVIREEIAVATARLIANPVAHKLKAAAIDELVERPAWRLSASRSATPAGRRRSPPRCAPGPGGAGVAGEVAGIVRDVRARGDAAVREHAERLDGLAPGQALRGHRATSSTPRSRRSTAASAPALEVAIANVGAVARAGLAGDVAGRAARRASASCCARCPSPRAGDLRAGRAAPRTRAPSSWACHRAGRRASTRSSSRRPASHPVILAAAALCGVDRGLPRWAAPRRSPRSPTGPRPSRASTSIAGPGRRLGAGGQAPGLRRRRHRRLRRPQRRARRRRPRARDAERGRARPARAGRARAGHASWLAVSDDRRAARRRRRARVDAGWEATGAVAALVQVRRPRGRAGLRRGLRARAPRARRRRGRGARPARARAPAACSSGARARSPSATTSPGSNHSLPTGGAARFASGLSARAFRRRMAEVRIGARGRRRSPAPAAPIARAEGFERHAESMEVREDG